MKSKTANLALLVLIVTTVSGCVGRGQNGTGDVTRRDAPSPAHQTAVQDPKKQTHHQAH